MKIKINKFLIFASFIFSCNITQANTLTDPKPDKCPTAEYIRMVGLDATEVYKNQVGWAVSTATHNLGTTNPWKFTIYRITANDSTQALTIAKNLLPSLELSHGPSPLGPKWQCIYSTDVGLNGYALTMDPPR